MSRKNVVVTILVLLAVVNAHFKLKGTYKFYYVAKNKYVIIIKNSRSAF